MGQIYFEVESNLYDVIIEIYSASDMFEDFFFE